MLPSFHCMGFMFQLMHPLQTGKAVSLFAPQHPKGPLPVTPESVIDGVRKSKSKAAFVMPSILEAWSHDEKAIETLRNMDWVVSTTRIHSSAVAHAARRPTPVARSRSRPVTVL
jgi:hypothetical protein